MLMYSKGRRILYFRPGYYHLIRQGIKRSTVRLITSLRSYSFKPGQEIMVVCMGEEYRATVTTAYTKSFGLIQPEELEHESPDSQTLEGLRCVLGNIFGTPIDDMTLVQVVHFEYTDTAAPC